MLHWIKEPTRVFLMKGGRYQVQSIPLGIAYPKHKLVADGSPYSNCFFVGDRDHRYNSAPELRTAMQIRTSLWTPRDLSRSKRNKAFWEVKGLIKIRPTTWILSFNAYCYWPIRPVKVLQAKNVPQGLPWSSCYDSVLHQCRGLRFDLWLGN